MAIPDYQSVMKPLLCLLGRRGVMSLGDAVDQLADELELTAEERAVLLPSGQYPLFRSRVGWAKTYLKQAGLLVQPKRGLMELSEEGRRLSSSPPERIDNAFLTRYEGFRDFMMRSGTRPTASSKPEDAMPADGPVMEGAQDGSAAPEETVEQAIHLLHEELRLELLDTVKTASPAFFERLVVQLLLRMGYGGSRQEAGEAVGRSGDGGIDGIINEDRLGLDAIYLQAKRWEGSVGEGPIRDFKGALDAKGAQKGVFITTSSFTPAAREAARNSRSYKIVLIDGARLADLMIEHDLGVSVAATYHLKRIDSDFFADE